MSVPTDPTSWSLDRETVVVRVLDAPRTAVWEAWVGPDIGEWFGPAGFTCSTFERDVRVGGVWRFEMVGPDGTVYPNRIEYLEIDAPSRLVFDHGDDDEDGRRFRVTLTLDEQADGKTVLTMRQLHATKEDRDMVISFGAVELGLQTLDKLAVHIGA